MMIAHPQHFSCNMKTAHGQKRKMLKKIAASIKKYKEPKGVIQFVLQSVLISPFLKAVSCIKEKIQT